MPVSLITALAVLSIPHWLYLFVWTRSKLFIELVKKYTPKSDAVDVFAFLATALKVVQFSIFGLWYFTNGACVKFSDIGVLRWLVGLALIAGGQALNTGIYNAIGKDGVYYGTRLGKKIPWYTGFPFTVVRDPQYVGSAMTIWAMLVLGYTPAHGEAGYAWLCVLWSLMYVPTALIESHF